MATVYLSLGSNIERYKNISAALNALAEQFGELTISPVYESVSVGFEGDNFLNLIVAIDTEMPVGVLSNTLREIENDNGRVRAASKFSARTLDIDILTYGMEVGVIDGVELPRDEITKYGFVITPLVDIAANGVLPGSDRTYQTIATELNLDEKDMWPVEFRWPDNAAL
ncbi:MAG: 2-amino-4-hydroxy-6-hydroxymethyldihydropteridine diphosphokinase [Chitinophagales bacterium]|jgi:2-amino-4-hydroxy-6-hydroxymethyldihydropteridine diphosphokinase|tara:strand:+ start:3713 stop:4219 length:507 start_codon:yes stop_codon:yes gene_type:complete